MSLGVDCAGGCAEFAELKAGGEVVCAVSATEVSFLAGAGVNCVYDYRVWFRDQVVEFLDVESVG